MGMTMQAVIASLLFVSALSLDTLAAAFSYGASKVKIPFGSAMAIDVIGSGGLAASLYAGAALRGLFSKALCGAVCALLLFLIGIIKLSDHLINRPKKGINGRCFKGAERYLSLKEAIPLAAALSLDGVTAGLGYGLTNMSYWTAAGLSFTVGAAAIALGGFIGEKIAQKTPLDLNWLSGVILIGLAVSKL